MPDRGEQDKRDAGQRASGGWQGRVRGRSARQRRERTRPSVLAHRLFSRANGSATPPPPTTTTTGRCCLRCASRHKARLALLCTRAPPTCALPCAPRAVCARSGLLDAADESTCTSSVRRGGQAASSARVAGGCVGGRRPMLCSPLARDIGAACRFLPPPRDASSILIAPHTALRSFWGPRQPSQLPPGRGGCWGAPLGSSSAQLTALLA